MPDIFGSNDSILCGERVMKRNRGCRGPILNTRVHHRWGAHSWLPGSLIKLKISIQTSDFWVNLRIHIGGVWGGDGQWEAGDSEISICWRLGGASATVQTLLTTMETLECMLRSDWGLLSCFICTKSGHKEVSSYPGQLLGVSLRMWDLMRRWRWQSGGGNLWRSLGPIVPALGWPNTGSGVKTAEIIPDAISLIAEDGQSGRAVRRLGA